MRVFISWSGERSRSLADALHLWLPDIIQNIEPWMSDHQISAGMRWNTELDRQLEGGNFGVLCLTPENLTAPWLLFESGALAKSVEESRVVPYRLGLSSAEVRPPLSQFQGVDADQKGTLEMLQSINQAQEVPLPEDRLKRLFDRAWPELEQKINAIREPAPEDETERRTEVDYLTEILEVVRRLATTREEKFTDNIDEIATILRKSLEVAEKAILSLEDYEAKGGGASTETFWPEVVGKAERKRDRLMAALRAIEGSRGM